MPVGITGQVVITVFTAKVRYNEEGNSIHIKDASPLMRRMQGYLSAHWYVPRRYVPFAHLPTSAPLACLPFPHQHASQLMVITLPRKRTSQPYFRSMYRHWQLFFCALRQSKPTTDPNQRSKNNSNRIYPSPPQSSILLPSLHPSFHTYS